jgi:hypothetical protein
LRASADLRKAKAGCPVSTLLKATITVDAKLRQAPRAFDLAVANLRRSSQLAKVPRAGT